MMIPRKFISTALGALLLTFGAQDTQAQLANESYEAEENPVDNMFSRGMVTLNLHSPVLENGVLTTDKGGVVSGPDIRIQAQKIAYTRRQEGSEFVVKIEAEGKLMVEYGERIFVGDSLTYDFNTHTGKLINGRTAMLPWYFGGDVITLKEDSSYSIENSYVTTCENRDSEWQVSADIVNVLENNLLEAKNIQVKVLSVPFFWVPTLKATFQTLFSSPVKYKVYFGGSQGPRLSMRQRVYSRENWAATLRLDLMLKKGLGGGVETEYKSDSGKTTFFTNNYAANDRSFEGNNGTHKRYRFEGIYKSKWDEDKFHIDGRYDRLSDPDMAHDFINKNFDLQTAARTEFEVRRLEEKWVAGLFARFRINGFQTLKQELPTIEWNYHPMKLGSSGVIMDSRVLLSSLDYKYAKGITTLNDFNSTRAEASQVFYRPWSWEMGTVTPRFAYSLVHYGNSPTNNTKFQAVGKLGAKATTKLSRRYTNHKHIILPYLDYEIVKRPKVRDGEHFIFDIEDGLSSLNMYRIGVENHLYSKLEDGYLREFNSDLYANGFINTLAVPKHIPAIYAKASWKDRANLTYGVHTGWNFAHNTLEHLNLLAAWTKDEDFAVSGEIRHRSKYDWRKSNHDNYFMDSLRPESEILTTALSDKRNTLISRIFYRFHPEWHAQFESRHGRGRSGEPGYNEYKLDLVTMVRCNWIVKFAYQHTEEDNRFGVNVKLAEIRPDSDEGGGFIWPSY